GSARCRCPRRRRCSRARRRSRPGAPSGWRGCPARPAPRPGTPPPPGCRRSPRRYVRTCSTDVRHGLRPRCDGATWEAAAVTVPPPPPAPDGPGRARGTPPPEASDLLRLGTPELLRGVEIWVTLAVVVLRAIAAHLVRHPRHLPGLLRRDREARRALADAAGTGLVAAFMALGPPFVKLGQLLA